MKALELPSGAEPSSFLRRPDFAIRKVTHKRLEDHMRKNEQDASVDTTFMTEPTLTGVDAQGGDMRWRRGVDRRTADLKDSIGQGPNQTNNSDQSSVRILPKFRNFLYVNFGKFQHFPKYRRNSDKISSKSEQRSQKRIQNSRQMYQYYLFHSIFTSDFD